MNLDAGDWERWCEFDREVCGRGFEFDLHLLTLVVVLLIDEVMIGDLDLLSREER